MIIINIIEYIRQIIYNMASINIAMTTDDILRTFVITMIITIVAYSIYIGVLLWGVTASLAILVAYTVVNAVKKRDVA